MLLEDVPENFMAIVSFNASRAIFFDHSLTASGWLTGYSVAAILLPMNYVVEIVSFRSPESAKRPYGWRHLC
jgi:hypothetical protein